MARKEVLNLYSGLGGNRWLWTDVNVTAVEINPDVAEFYAAQFPDDRVIVGDAHEVLEKAVDKYDFIWSSPPCQSHTRMVGVNGMRKYPDLKLYEEILFLQRFCKADWVVENVVPYYKPLIHGEARGRHMFWSNRYIPEFNTRRIPDLMNITSREALEDALGIVVGKNIYLDSNDPLKVLRNCVHPELGKEIFEICTGR